MLRRLATRLLPAFAALAGGLAATAVVVFGHLRKPPPPPIRVPDFSLLMYDPDEGDESDPWEVPAAGVGTLLDEGWRLADEEEQDAHGDCRD